MEWGCSYREEQEEQPMAKARKRQPKKITPVTAAPVDFKLPANIKTWGRLPLPVLASILNHCEPEKFTEENLGQLNGRRQLANSEAAPLVELAACLNCSGFGLTSVCADSP